MNETILSVTGVSKSYKNKKVLDDISFQVHQGEILALLGVNGAGKSTLINIINQLIPAEKGQVQFFGQQENKKINRQQVGVMMQKNIQLTRVSVKETLKLAASYYQTPLPYNELIALADLKEQEEQIVSKLSGGQKRRLSFAVALAGNPKFVFLDEPTAGMDSSSRQKMWRVIDSLKQQGKTFFVTSHYLDELESFADRIMILKDTQIVFDGDLETLRLQTGLAEVSFHSELSEKVFQGIPEIAAIHTTGTFHRLMTNNVNQLIIELVPYLNGIDNLSIKQNSLESLFVSINEGGTCHV